MAVPCPPTEPAEVQNAPTATGSAGKPTLIIDTAPTRACPLSCCSGVIDAASISVDASGIAAPVAVNDCPNEVVAEGVHPVAGDLGTDVNVHRADRRAGGNYLR